MPMIDRFDLPFRNDYLYEPHDMFDIFRRELEKLHYRMDLLEETYRFENRFEIVDIEKEKERRREEGGKE